MIISPRFTLPLVRFILDEFPLISFSTSVGNCRIVGSLTIGNRHGLVVPSCTTDTELQYLRNSLPDSIRIHRCDSRLSALGNIISCNDYVALIHPDLDRDTEEILTDTLKVECFRHKIDDRALVGSYCVLNNQGGLVRPRISIERQDELSSLLQVPITTGTVNRGSDVIGAGMIVNDWIGFCGLETSAQEISVLDSIFQLGKYRVN